MVINKYIRASSALLLLVQVPLAVAVMATPMAFSQSFLRWMEGPSG
jgi:hypothetical protein